MRLWEMPMTDPALDFWLRHVAADGGLHEPSGDATYVVLPPALSERYRLPEELRVTADPDIARDDGVTLLALGHPVLADSAERVLASGDAGIVRLRPPASVPPSPDVLLQALRDAVPVDHGKIDVADPPAAARHPVIRVGALVTFELSAEDQFQEQAERWVDVPSRRLLQAAITGRLSRAEPDEVTAPDPAGPRDDVRAAVAEAHRLIDAAALARRAELAVGVRDVYQAERARAVYPYYLSGQDGLVAEVLPSTVFQDGRLSSRYWWHEPGDPHWRLSRVPKGADIDVVGRILLGTGPSWNGLCVAARSVAAWERIAGSHERIVDGRAPRAVAAAVERLVAYRAGGRGTFADAAAVYRVDEAAVRSADRAVRPVLALAPGRAW
jgi:hypothetical protein